MSDNFLRNIQHMMAQFPVWPLLLFLNNDCKDFVKGPQLRTLSSKKISWFWYNKNVRVFRWRHA